MALPSSKHPGTPVLHAGQFASGKGRFAPLDYKPVELPDKDYPLVLASQPSLDKFYAGAMVGKVDGFNTLKGEGTVEINPADANKLGIDDGDTVKVSSRRGELTAQAKITEASPVGVVYTAFRLAGSPASLAVRVENR